MGQEQTISHLFRRPAKNGFLRSGMLTMRMMIDLAFLATATLVAIAYALADPASIDTKSSAEECRALAANSAAYRRIFESYEQLLGRNSNIDPEQAYFDRFDGERTITLRGTVNEHRWTNPRAGIMRDRDEWTGGVGTPGLAAEDAKPRYADHYHDPSAAGWVEWRPPLGCRVAGRQTNARRP
jgi:hypothetical protein